MRPRDERHNSAIISLSRNVSLSLDYISIVQNVF